MCLCGVCVGVTSGVSVCVGVEFVTVFVSESE